MSWNEFKLNCALGTGAIGVISLVTVVVGVFVDASYSFINTVSIIGVVGIILFFLIGMNVDMEE